MPTSFTRGLPHPRSPGERALYQQYLRGRLKGAQFNVPVGPYYVDLFFRDARLVVEIDGRAYHSSPEAKAVDRRRDEALRAAGLTVLRFSSKMATDHTDTVVGVIRDHLELMDAQVPKIEGETLLQRMQRSRELELARTWATRTVAHVEAKRGSAMASQWEDFLSRALHERFGAPSTNDLATLRKRVDLAVALWEARCRHLGLQVPRATRRPGA